MSRKADLRNLLRNSAWDIQALRREREIMSAKLEIVELFRDMLYARPGSARSVGMAEDVVPRLLAEAEKLEAELQAENHEKYAKAAAANTATTSGDRASFGGSGGAAPDAVVGVATGRGGHGGYPGMVINVREIERPAPFAAENSELETDPTRAPKDPEDVEHERLIPRQVRTE